MTDVAHIEPHGGSLQVSIMRKGAGRGASASVQALLQEESRTLTPETLADFRTKVETQVAALKDLLVRQKGSGHRVAGYGAPARVSTICNYGKIGPT